MGARVAGGTHRAGSVVYVGLPPQSVEDGGLLVCLAGGGTAVFLCCVTAVRPGLVPVRARTICFSVALRDSGGCVWVNRHQMRPWFR